MKEHPGLLTNSEWTPGNEALFSSYNPSNGELIWQGRGASKEQVDLAIQQANQAFASWSNLTIDQRSDYLEKYGEILKNHAQEMAEIISQETGKPLWESKTEVASMINKIPISLEAYGSRCPGIINEQAKGRSITRHRPHGVVAVLGPYNFPGHLPGSHIIPALLAGNTVVFKPSEMTPLVGELMMTYWQMSGLPPGVLNLVQGSRETGQALVQHPDIHGIFFTGSYRTGLLLSEYFSTRLGKILALELGGNNPLIVSQITDLEAAAYLTIQSAYLTSGQRCTCARRLIVPEGKIGDAFIKCLTKMIEKILIGDYTDKPEPFMGPVISETQVQHLLEAQTKLQEKGGNIIIEMKALKQGTGYISPGLMDVTSVADRPDEEYFGPFLQLIRTKDFSQAVQEANRTKYGLSAGLFSDNHEEYQEFYQSIRAGIINWNMQLTGASSEAPFGGVGCSGNYHPSAYYAADYCSYPTASMEAQQLKKPEIFLPGIPPISEEQLKLFL